MYRVDGGFAAPTLAPYFAGRSRSVRGHDVGQLLTQIEVATNAFVVLANEREHGLGVGEVHGVFDLTAPGDAFGTVVCEIHRQGLQERKLVRETG